MMDSSRPPSSSSSSSSWRSLWLKAGWCFAFILLIGVVGSCFHDIGYRPSTSKSEDPFHDEKEKPNAMIIATNDDDDDEEEGTRNFCHKDHHWQDHPVLCQMLQLYHEDPESMADMLRQHAMEHHLLVGQSWIAPSEEEQHNSSPREEVVASPRHLLRSATSSFAETQEQQQHETRNDDANGDATATTTRTTTTTKSSPRQRPVVFAHGMGDSCFNSGMQQIVEMTSQLLNGTFVTCIPIGSNQVDDTNSGYFVTMQENVNQFAQGVLQLSQEKKELFQNGFHAIGFSQGCNIVRGYIEYYNGITTATTTTSSMKEKRQNNEVRENDPLTTTVTYPIVHSFLSVNGVNAGEGAVPHCRPEQSRRDNDNHPPMDTTAMTPRRTATAATAAAATTTMSVCELLMEQASRAAYTEFSQQHSFQANYWRDPRPVMFPTYQKYAQLAVWNQEATPDNPNLCLFHNDQQQDQKKKKNVLHRNNNNNNSNCNNNHQDDVATNWNRTSQFVWILAEQDGMVIPREGEHWCAPDPNDPFGPILPMKATTWYQEDLFGLRTADELGKNYFESFEGDHLQFSQTDFERWVHSYLKN